MIDPRFMGPFDWTAQTTPLIQQFGQIPKLLDAEAWKTWAAYVVSLPGLAAVGATRPEGFGEWRHWAHEFNRTVRLVAG